MKQPWLMFAGLVLCAGLATPPAFGDEDLDAELDAEWGDRRVKTYTVETPESQFEARLKILEAARDAEKERCKSRSGGNRYCGNYADENFRKEVRALKKQFEDAEELPEVRRKSRGFGRVR
ncbi:MAG: hypothetical protein AB7O21_17890 [Gammaproteobacteria bacterium]